ncbi:hypothetical protein EST38_g3739 [Candolleomyces aberdarensis]|uniref:lytic cellulose monooxygenase (C4-dehydrogenating) n=1 Tax=Candolleomyces aberdarensis TaxID=2316362 RepID=A0A4Q2DQ00_9AGAR|nr:hypothetical protein EST38_g3739 [Candolleomyces aberdarensis]
MPSLVSIVASACLLFAAQVAGHGYVQEITLGSTKHVGYLPYSDPYYNPPLQRIVRKIPGNGPVEDHSLIDVQCNGWSAGGVVGSAPAPLVATVAAGATVKFNWTEWPDSHKGPIITYMARAPSDITKWNPGNSAVWFKIDHSGKDASGRWAAAETLVANRGIYTTRIPPRLRPGQYIIRHEILALHGAWSYPGVQVYPSCVQVEVTGSGSASPTSFVSFPGAYTAQTPGIVFDVYTNNGAYPIPGPAVYHIPTPQRIVRKVPGNSPLVGTIAAGDVVKFNWTDWPDSHRGPVLNYLARVPDGVDITKWTPDKDAAIWFKIDHAGKYEDGTWAADMFVPPNNKLYSLRIPPKLKPGQYLIRHEILALHGAFNFPGIQAYPVCVQVEITGNGTAFPTSFVSFPGAYTPETPGVVFNIYDTWGNPPYPIPGPEVWTGGN